MNIQKLYDQNIYDEKLPAKAAVIQLLDKNKNHLAFVTYFYQQEFHYLNFSGGYQESQFLQEISDIENEMMHTCFKMDKDLERKCSGWWRGEFIITDETSEIIYHSKPASNR